MHLKLLLHRSDERDDIYLPPIMVMEEEWPSVKPVLTALVAIVLLLLLTVRKKSKYRLPPGPTPWPVLGNLLLLGNLPHQSLAKLAKKYGRFMSLKIGSRTVVIVSCPKIAEEILKKQDKIWASRPATPTAQKIMGYGGVDIAFAPYGPQWRYAKKIFLLELFTAKRLSDFQERRREEILRGIRGLLDRCCNGTRAQDVGLTGARIATNIVMSMAMNGGVLSDEASALKDADDFQQIIKDGFRLSGAFYLGDFIPWLDRLDPQGLKKEMRALAKKYDIFLQRILEDHKLKHQTPDFNLDDGAQLDIVDTLLTRPSELDGQTLSEEEMKAILQDVIFGGTDTTSGTIEWAMTELLKNPRILERAQAEMDSVVGRDRLVEESDLPNLPYLNAITKETHRLHPAAPLMVPHMSTEDCEIEGYRIPAGTTCMVNIYAYQRDPEVYDRALEFDPERFLGSKKDVHGQDFDLLPFGSGRRMCPGKGLAVVVVEYSVALLIQMCNWSLPGNMKPEDLDLEEGFGLSLPKRNPLLAVAAPRLPEHVLRDLQT